MIVTKMKLRRYNGRAIILNTTLPSRVDMAELHVMDNNKCHTLHSDSPATANLQTRAQPLLYRDFDHFTSIPQIQLTVSADQFSGPPGWPP